MGQKIIKLTGRLVDGSVAKTHQAKEVVNFQNEAGTVSVMYDSGSVLLSTQKGSYKLDKHLSIVNLYTGIASGYKVHFTGKKIVGKLIYWGSYEVK